MGVMSPVPQAQEGFNEGEKRHPQIKWDRYCGYYYKISADAKEVFDESGHKGEGGLIGVSGLEQSAISFHLDIGFAL